MKMSFAVGRLKDPGRVRREQEDDAAYVVPEDPDELQVKGAVFVVADGVGGRTAGDIASRMAVDLIPMTYYDDSGSDRLESLRLAMQRANQAIYQERQRPNQGQMATTAVCAVINNGELIVGHVGDSRAYLWHQGQLKQLTQDHSWVAEQVAQGLLSEQDARVHPNRHVITRALGNQPAVVPEIRPIGPLQAGDRVLLCSDGLYEEVEPDEIASVMQRYEPRQACHALIERANQMGGNDNISVVVVEYQELPTGDDATLPRKTLTIPVVSPIQTEQAQPRAVSSNMRTFYEVEHRVSYHHERHHSTKRTYSVFQLPSHREVHISITSHAKHQIHGLPAIVELSIKLGDIEKILYLMGFMDVYAYEKYLSQFIDRLVVVASGQEVTSFEIGRLRFYLHLSDCSFYHSWGKNLRSFSVTIRVQSHAA